MKRYLVFGFENQEGSGGWNDFIGAFDDLDEANAAALPYWNHRVYEAHIVDTQTMKIIKTHA